jgi:uncharacterized membrane protein
MMLKLVWLVGRVVRFFGCHAWKAVLAIAAFLVCGGLSFSYAVSGHRMLKADFPFIMSTPYFLVLVVIGFSGLFLVYEFPKLVGKNEGKAKQNFWFGVGLVLLCYLGIELMFP